MQSKILVPTDFSPCAYNAIDYAINLAELIEGEIMLFHAYLEVNMAFINQQELSEENKRRAVDVERAFVETINYLKGKNSSVKFRQFKETGPEVDSVIDFIEKEDIDYIVMGSHGATGLKEYGIGSFTAEVVRRSKCPVFVVPEVSFQKKLKNIICTSSLHQSELVSAYHLTALAKKINANITVVNVDEKTDSQNTKLKKFTNELEKISLVPLEYNLITSSEIIPSIEKLVADSQPDLIVTLGEETSFFDKIFRKSVKMELALHTHYPLLCFPAEPFSYETIKAIEAGIKCRLLS